MSTIWSWNEIDVYVSLYDNVLGDASVATNLWVPLSNYGLLRGRVALKPSTVEGNSETIPGRDGKPYSVYSSRGNATLSFELLVADEWIPTHKQLNMTLRQRLDTIEAYLNRARRIAYKQPGRPCISYFEVYKVKLTENDAYEEAQTLKAEIEVHPFEFYFSGNAPITILKNTYTIVNNALPMDECCPSFVVPQGFDGSISVSIPNVYTPSSFDEITTSGAPVSTIIDTFHGLVYAAADASVNINAYFDGDFKDLWLPSASGIRVTNSSTTYDIVMYTRGGIIR